MSPAPAPADRRKPDPARPERFVFLLLENFTLIAFAGAIEPLRIANRMAGRTLYEWQVVSETGGPVTASNGVVVQADGGLGELGRETAIIVVGGLQVKQAISRPVLTWLRREARRGMAIGAVCTGAQVIAAGGAARRPALHHPLGEPRQLRGGLPRHRADAERLRHRPRPLHRRRRRRLDRPDAEADRAAARRRAREPRRRPDDPHLDPLRQGRAAAVDPDPDRRAPPQARHRDPPHGGRTSRSRSRR